MSLTSPLQITLFGPPEVRTESGPIPRLRSRKALWTLALLALRQGRDVDRQWLAAMLWPDIDKSQSLANLRPALSELRAALGPAADRLRTDGRLTVWLDIDGAEIDVLRYDSFIADGSPRSLEQALELYSGPLLEGCSESWVFQERNSRKQACLDALFKLAEFNANESDYKSAIRNCERAVSLDPTFDTTRRRLMEILEQSGDLNGALQTYREFADLLRSELGAVPDEKTTAAYLRLRRRVHQLGKPKPALQEAKSSQSRLVGYLPHPITILVGREDERLEVTAKLRHSRIMTLAGPGGMGKTRLALAVAAEAAREGVTYPDGVWLVALESLTDPRQVISQIMTVLGVREEAGSSLPHSLANYLRDKRTLLVLDNCEHLLDASAQIANLLLRESGGLKILTTSREPLGITGEVIWTVPPLSSPNPDHLPSQNSSLIQVLSGYEGVQLFVDRAQAVLKSFTLNQDTARPVAQICAKLEGLPLAIELAAARVKAMNVAEIAVNLDRQLDLLSNGSRVPLHRHQTLRASLDWSYSLLDRTEQTLLRRLSVFVGGFTTESAEAVCVIDGVPSGGLLDPLSSLIDKSLVVFESQVGGDPELGGRYPLLETVRRYGLERLSESGEFEALSAAHLRFFLELAEETEPKLAQHEQGFWLKRLGAERANFRAALEWAESTPAAQLDRLKLAGVLGQFWEMQGYYREGREFLAKALQATGSDDHSRTRAKALNSAGSLALYQGDLAESEEYQAAALEIWREHRDGQGIAWSLNRLGDVHTARGDDASAERFYLGSLEEFRKLGNVRGIASLLHHIGRLMRDRGDLDGAKHYYEEGLQSQRNAGDKQGIAWALHHLGHLAGMRGEMSLTWSLQEEGLNLFRELGHRQGEAWSLSELGLVAARQRNFTRAKQLYSESLEIFQNLGMRIGSATVLKQMASLADDMGEKEDAKTLRQESDRISEELGLASHEAPTMLDAS